MPQLVMPLFPHGTTHINNLLAFSCEEGTVTYFNGSMPLFSHRETDVASFHMIIAQFYLNGHVKQADLCRAFGVTAISVKRAVKLHREQGVKGFFVPRKGRGPVVLTASVMTQAQALLDGGMASEAVADQLGIKRDTLGKAVRAGRLHVAKKKTVPPSPKKTPFGT